MYNITGSKAGTIVLIVIMMVMVRNALSLNGNRTLETDKRCSISFAQSIKSPRALDRSLLSLVTRAVSSHDLRAAN